MADRERVLAPMDLNGNLKENWSKWRHCFELYSVASETDKKPEKVQCAIILHYIGEQCIDIYNTFTFPSTTERKVEEILKKFEDYFIPKVNETFERHKFFTRSQSNFESVDQYATQLKSLANNCEFGNLKDSLVRDRLICGIKDANVREKLLQIQGLNLQRAVEICRTAEISSEQSRQITTSSNEFSKATEICMLKRRQGQNTSHASSSKLSMSRTAHHSAGATRWRDINVNSRKVCKKCGKFHEFKKCPAYGKKCFKCNKINHFTKCCLSKDIDTI